MKNNGKANAMETLKAKVLELKKKVGAPFLPLVVLAVFIALPMVGGTLALGTYLVGADALTVVWVVGALVYYTVILYKMIHGFLTNLDTQFTAKPVHNDEDFS